MVRDVYDENFIQQNCLVKVAQCGGYQEQPVCLYDFRVKNQLNDCLAFSTRHIAAKGKLNLILEDYIEVRHSESNEIEEEEKVAESIIREESKS